MVALRDIVLPLTICLGIGCASCESCSGDKPYTPFGVTSALPSESSMAVEEAVPDAAPEFAVRKSELAPRDATRWRLAGKELAAPSGQVFVMGLAADFDADGKHEAYAVTKPKNGGPAELWSHALDKPRKLWAQPGFVPTGAGCTSNINLTQSGPRTLTLDVSASCSGQLLARVPVRSISVLAPGRSDAAVVSLRAAAPAPGEQFDIDVRTRDIDADGRDDVSVVCSVARKGSQRPASAQFVWFDRAQGLSRDTREPDRSFSRLAGVAGIRAAHKSYSKSVGDEVENAIRLISSVCAEAGVPRLFDAEGSPLRCQLGDRLPGQLSSAELSAALTQKDHAGALAALERDGWYLRPALARERKQMVDRLNKAFSKVEPRSTKLELEVEASDAPRLSPLDFTADGQLLVQSTSGLRQVSMSGEVSTPSDEAGVASWSLRIEQGEHKLARVVPSCDRSEITLGFEPALSDPFVTQVVAPRPGACAGKSPRIVLSPLGYKDDKLSAYLAGALVGPAISVGEAALRPHLAGSARSSDGKLSVVPSQLGAAVLGGDKPQLWSLPADAQPVDGCVVANGAKALACSHGRSVWLLIKP